MPHWQLVRIVRDHTCRGTDTELRTSKSDYGGDDLVRPSPVTYPGVQPTCPGQLSKQTRRQHLQFNPGVCSNSLPYCTPATTGSTATYYR